MLGVIMLGVTMLGVIMLGVTMLGVIMLNDDIILDILLSSNTLMVGSWPYPQTIDKDGKTFQEQSI